MLLKPKAQTTTQLGDIPPWGARPAPEIRSGSRPVPNRLPNRFVAATVVSQTTPGHQKGLPSLILDSVWEPWLLIGDSGPLREPYYSLCFHHKTPLGTGRVPNKTLTCIHGASETTFFACFSPL